jgi:hypothetical protein
VDGTFATPTGLAYTDDGLLVSDYNNQGDASGNIRLIGPDGTISTVAGEANTGGCVGAGGSPTGALWPVFYITAPHGARAYKPIVVKFVSTRATVVRTSLLHRGHRIRTVRRPGRAGLNRIALAGVARGSYRMEIAASATLENNNQDQGGALKLNKRFKAPLMVKR